MDADLRKRLLEALDLCWQARERLGADGVHRTRVVLDMALMELGKELLHCEGAAKAPRKQ